MDLETAVRTRRTHKAYGHEPVDRTTLLELFDLARWAPNHHLTNPWRFRVLGPESLARLKEAAGPEAAGKLDRAPTLVVASAVQCGDDPGADEEGLVPTSRPASLVRLGAHSRGLAASWPTPAVLRTPEGRAAAGIPDGEHVLGLLHLGPGRQDARPPERHDVDAVVEFLD